MIFVFIYGIFIGKYEVFPYSHIKYLKNIVSKNLLPPAKINLEAKSRSIISFVAYGDNVYVHKNDVIKTISRLLDFINDQNPSLVIHTGDSIGKEPCTDFIIDLQRDLMNRLNSPVLYTPGDNEWRDCKDKTKSDNFNLNRLDYIRKTYFNNKQTLGKNPIFIENQESERYPENSRLMIENVGFITSHVVGSNNNFDPKNKQNLKEYIERDTANIEWIIESFKKYEKASAIVVAIHANMFDATLKKLKPAYHNFGKTLFDLSNKYKKPVLLLHGDTHTFREYRPKPKKYPFLYAIEVFGYPDIKAIEIAVVSSEKKPFHIVKIINNKINE